MRPLLIALALAAALILAGLGALLALGRVLGVGPFAPGAPASWVYVAISRGQPTDADAREIEVIDFASGERQLFTVEGGRIFDLALSRDRRTLFVASANGTILELDSIHGAILGEIRLSTSADVRRLIVLPQSSRLMAIGFTGLESTAALVDLGTRREIASISLGNRFVGRSVARDDVVLSVSDRTTTTERLLTLGVEPLAVREETILNTIAAPATRTAAAALTLSRDGAVVAISPAALRLTVIAAGTGVTRSVEVRTALANPGAGLPLPAGADADVITSADGRVIHFCVGTSQRGERFTASWESLSARVIGAECGSFARLADGSLFLAVRARPELKALDPATGAVLRTLALAGYPQRMAY